MFFLLGCLAEDPNASNKTNVDNAQADLSGKNIVLLHIDTLRYNRMSMNGYERETMPLTAEFPWYQIHGEYASTSWTAPSTASMLSGLYPQNHDVRYFQTDLGSLNSELEAPTLTTQLRNAGYKTFLGSGNAFVSDGTGLGRDFESEVLCGEEPLSSNLNDLIDPTLDWLDSTSDGHPFFIMLQPFDPHLAYSPPTEYLGTWSDPESVPFDIDTDSITQADQIFMAWKSEPELTNEAIGALYDEQVLGLDASIHRLLTELEARGVLKDTLVVLTSDHGEGLNEDNKGSFSHGYSLSEEQLKIPFMLLNPEIGPGERDCLMENVDLQATLLSYVGVPALEGDGQPIQESCRDLAQSSLYDLLGNLAQVGVTDGHWRATKNCLNNGILLEDVSGDGETLPAEATQKVLEEGLDSWLQKINDVEPEAGCQG